MPLAGGASGPGRWPEKARPIGEPSAGPFRLPHVGERDVGEQKQVPAPRRRGVDDTAAVSTLLRLVRSPTSGRGPAWSGRVPRTHENAGSNPAVPTENAVTTPHRIGMCGCGGGRQTEGQADRRRHPARNGTRPQALEGSTPSPSADGEVPVAERPRRRSSKPARRVRLPPGTLALFDKAADGYGPVGNRQTTPAQNEGC